MKTLIIGARGMLGQELAKVFVDCKPYRWDLAELDITNKSQVEEKLGDLFPELVINAAAYTNVDGCETNEATATRVNGQAVGYLAEAAAKIGATLVHYSTDYVFDGNKREGYVEDDAGSPINAYGRTKLAGEQAILSSPLKNYYLIRTAWLYGQGGKNFVETMLALADKKRDIRVVNDQIGSPTYAPDLARATREIIDREMPFGVYHRTNSGVTSWYEFAKKIFQIFGRQVDLSPCATSEYPTPAKRPKYSVLVSTKLPAMRSWPEALATYKDTRNKIQPASP